ncbi:11340_t:CDS:2 [Funneliformis caledonium]|uniref:11340_t:CDS:1 n=1 Tax=Funneliformis caledonium TaxID=1117310 RepID=A0A9N8YKC8_9GLOM|nr:11340_t:CDS:2 [Funneliformis caledonium]
MLRFNGNEEQYNTAVLTKEAGDDERENGDNTIIRTNSPRLSTPGSYTKKSSLPMSTPTRIRRHSFTPDEKPPKGINYNSMPPPTKVVTPADAAAVLASLTPPFNGAYINHDKKHSHKHTVDDKLSKKQLKRSISFNHSNRPISPRQTAPAPYIDVAEVLATTVSFVRENNKKLDRLSDEVRSDGQSSDYDMDSDDSMDSYQQSSNNGEIENEIHEIQMLAVQLDDMEQKYKEQLRGKNRLIEQLENSLKKSGKDQKKRRIEVERLESQLEAARRAINELVEQMGCMTRGQSPDPELADNLRTLEQELEGKNVLINELNKKIQISNRQAIESKEKEKKLELISNQLLKYQSLESEWQDKQKTLDSLTSQLEILRKREYELHEKDALIETLNIRLDTSQKVIAELREKHAPHDLLRQLRQKDYIIDTLTQQVENIDSDMKDKDDDISALTAKLTEEKRQIEKLKEQTAQIEPLKKKVEDAEDAAYDIQTKLSQKERQLVELEKRYKEASRNSQDSQDQLISQEQTISALRQEISQLRQAFTVQSTETREKDRLLTTLRDETAHMRSNYQGLLNALSEKDQRIQQFEQHLESLQNASKSDSHEKESKISKNEVRLNALQKVLNNKIEACRDYEKKIVDLEKDFDVLKSQFEETRSASSEKEIKITRLVKMNRQLKEEVSELKQKMEEKEKELVLIKSKIPKPNPGKAPAASVRSAPTKGPRSRVSSMYSASGGESSSDEAAKSGRPRIRKAASLSGIDNSPLKNKTTFSSVSRRTSDSPRVALARSRSSTSTSSLDQKRRSNLAPIPKRDVKPRLPSTVNTVDVLKKRRDAITSNKESSPINRSAVTQRKRDMEVLNHMLSGVAPDRKNRSSTLAQKRSTTTESGSSKKKLTDTVSSDSDREIKKSSTVKRSSDLTTIMEKIRNNDDSASKTTRPKASRPIVNTQASSSTMKARTSLSRPLPSKKP